MNRNSQLLDRSKETDAQDITASREFARVNDASLNDQSSLIGHVEITDEMLGQAEASVNDHSRSNLELRAS